MKQGIITTLLIIGCVVLAVFSGFIVLSKDNTPPVITVPNEEIQYINGDDQQILLQGVTATDNEDGDLTAKVFIEKIEPVDDGQAVVYYAVIDSSKNVAEAKRIVSYLAERPVPTPAPTPTPTPTETYYDTW